MASVEHQCCVRILAVCMTAQMMLVTQLMPLGCLLDYVRKNKVNVGSKVLLNWSTQIARVGDKFQSPRCVKFFQSFYPRRLENSAGGNGD